MLEQSIIIVKCEHNIHFLSYNGSVLYPPAGGLGSGNGQLRDHGDPMRLSADRCIRVYVADTFNNRIAVFRGNGRFITNLETDSYGMRNPYALVFHNNSLYIANFYSDLYVMELT